MYVPSNCHGRQRQRCRVPFGVACMLAFAAIGAAAQPVTFDEKVKAPLTRSQFELRPAAKSYVERFDASRAAGPEQLITNSALVRERFDLVWQVQRLIDQGQPLGEFADAGIVARVDGSYVIDLKLHPEWSDLHQTISGLLSGQNLEKWLPLLANRGFRPGDVEIVRAYEKAHDLAAASAAATVPVSLAFGRTVRKLDKLKRPVPDALIDSFVYQRARAANESRRLWVVGLMKELDAQRGRILVSSFLELGGTDYWIPEDIKDGLATILADVRRPDYEAQIAAEAKATEANGVAP